MSCTDRILLTESWGDIGHIISPGISGSLYIIFPFLRRFRRSLVSSWVSLSRILFLHIRAFSKRLLRCSGVSASRSLLLLSRFASNRRALCAGVSSALLFLSNRLLCSSRAIRAAEFAVFIIAKFGDAGPVCPAGFDIFSLLNRTFTRFYLLIRRICFIKHAL